MKNAKQYVMLVFKTVIGSAMFAAGLNLFLIPNALNAGGISGLAMVFVHFTNIGSIGTVTAIINLPLFILGGLKVGKRFLVGSVIGLLSTSVFIDLLALLPAPQTEPLIGSLYGGALCGLGLGIVFASGASTGGSDIVARLLKLKWQNVPIGLIGMLFDACVALLTGLVFGDIRVTLYSGIAIFVSGQVVDAVVYRFDYSRVALIISKRHGEIADAINGTLQRGVTYLEGEGYYTHNATKVILTAVKRQQLAELKQLVVAIDPDAFIIVQEAHQVLGDGFSRYSKDSL